MVRNSVISFNPNLHVVADSLIIISVSSRPFMMALNAFPRHGLKAMPLKFSGASRSPFLKSGLR